MPPVPLRDASIVTARPIVPGPLFTPAQPSALTSGYQLDRTAVGGENREVIKRGRYGRALFTSNSDFNSGAQAGAPWPTIAETLKIFTAWRPNALREITVKTLPGNYGAITSIANFGFRHQIYPVNNQPWGSQAGYPGTANDPSRNLWNNVVAIVWRLRVANPTAGGSLDSTVQGAYTAQSYNNPTAFTPAGTATLSYK